VKTKDEKLTEAVVLILIGRVALPIGLTLLITHAFFGRPAHLVRPLVGTGVGLLLLAAAASRLDDARWLTSELARSLTIASLVVAAAALRLYFGRAPHFLTHRELVAAIACAAGFVGGGLWLRRER
jgi:hypothetical protein